MDMQGSTTAWTLEADLTCEAVLHLKELATEMAKIYSGVVENFTGDGYMVSFSGGAKAAPNAVAFAAVVQEKWRPWRENHLKNTDIHDTLWLRMGLHYGWARRLSSDELVGPTLNEAQRLESACRPQNELCLLSSAVLSSFRTQKGLKFGKQRTYWPKGKKYAGKDGLEKARELATPLLAFALSTRPAEVASMAVGQEENQKLLGAAKIYEEGNALFDLAQATEDVAEKKRLFVEAGEKYERAVTLKPDDSDAWYNWGNALVDLAQATEDVAEKKRLFVEACKKYEQAVTLQPDASDAWCNWGVALDDLARATENPTDKKRLLNEAFEKYQQAVKIQPDFHTAWYNWGNTLAGLAQATEDPTDKKRLFLEACKKYEEAVTLKPDYDLAWDNWGIALCELAQATEDLTDKKRLLNEAFEKYQQAVTLKPNARAAWRNWSLALSALAGITEDENERQRLLNEALEKFEKAISLNPD